jgi:hypothetical protein
VIANYYKHKEKVLDLAKNDVPFSEGVL